LENSLSQFVSAADDLKFLTLLSKCPSSQLMMELNLPQLSYFHLTRWYVLQYKYIIIIIRTHIPSLVVYMPAAAGCKKSHIILLWIVNGPTQVHCTFLLGQLSEDNPMYSLSNFFCYLLKRVAYSSEGAEPKIVATNSRNSPHSIPLLSYCFAFSCTKSFKFTSC
jgi:hypothetical protein